MMSRKFSHSALAMGVILLAACSDPKPEATTTTPEPATSAPESIAATEAVTDNTLTTPEMPVAEPNPAANQQFVEGQDYQLAKNPSSVEKPDMIEVREFFWYGCGHCYNLESYTSNWLKTKPADVNFVRTPAAMNPVWEQNARGYYAVDLMGKMTPELHEALFDEIHQRSQKIFDQKSLASFYAGHGIDQAKFDGLYNSFAVNAKVSQSKNLATRYQLSGVPSIIVNGKYIVGGDGQKVVQVVNYLVDQERQRLAKPQS
ncbi:MAG: thiol:disulfide interchange protein DsbA/DsbL [Pseudomonadota bacterium]|nr:thiol:disulfide interchange protein DsbA/DsbL [Pseudomonadota bacterium]